MRLALSNSSSSLNSYTKDPSASPTGAATGSSMQFPSGQFFTSSSSATLAVSLNYEEKFLMSLKSSVVSKAVSFRYVERSPKLSYPTVSMVTS